MTARPNIILILADDMGYGDFGCFNYGASRTPTLDHLVRDGVCLTQHYSASPVCAPARASLMTGRYPHRTGVIDTLETRGLDRLALREVTIAELLQARGLRDRPRRQMAQRRVRFALSSEPPRLRRVRGIFRRLAAVLSVESRSQRLNLARRRPLPDRRLHRRGDRVHPAPSRRSVFSIPRVQRAAFSLRGARGRRRAVQSER